LARFAARAGNDKPISDSTLSTRLASRRQYSPFLIFNHAVSRAAPLDGGCSGKNVSLR
jgi:hypothetical protein